MIAAHCIASDRCSAARFTEPDGSQHEFTAWGDVTHRHVWSDEATGLTDAARDAVVATLAQCPMRGASV